MCVCVYSDEDEDDPQCTDDEQLAMKTRITMLSPGVYSSEVSAVCSIVCCPAHTVFTERQCNALHSMTAHLDC